MSEPDSKRNHDDSASSKPRPQRRRKGPKSKKKQETDMSSSKPANDDNRPKQSQDARPEVSQARNAPLGGQHPAENPGPKRDGKRRQRRRKKAPPAKQSASAALNPNAPVFSPSPSPSSAPPSEETQKSDNQERRRGKRTRGGAPNRRRNNSQRSAGVPGPSADDTPRNEQKEAAAGRKPAADQPETAASSRRRRNRPSTGAPRGHSTKQVFLARQNSKNTNLAKEMIAKLARDEIECSICFERIGRRGKVWTCDRCYVILHLRCVQNWAQARNESTWLCPGCLHETQGIPSQYLCYCGQVVDPPYNAFLTPHSCGNICQKSLGHECPHQCTLPCHPGEYVLHRMQESCSSHPRLPGACPPCAAMGPLRTCCCGRTSYRLRCGEQEKAQRTCDGPCEKVLACQNPDHICQKQCHTGNCDVCSETQSLTCFCNRTKRDLPCGAGKLRDPSNPDAGLGFTCGRRCGKKLNCGNHFCRQTCHEGLCQPCERMPTGQNRQTCACGQDVITYTKGNPRRSCTDPLPTCDAICSKPLSCTRHTCDKPCHDSDCGPCDRPVTVACRCRSSSNRVSCRELGIPGAEQKGADEFLCKKVCKRLLSCKKHRCGQECCEEMNLPKNQYSPLHQCTKVCGGELNCEKHTCQGYCHAGFCEPCARVVRDGLSCRCGKTQLPGPVKCGTKLPKCFSPCTAERDCEHKCRYTCHEGKCPPCAFLVERTCAGGHQTMKNIPCHATNVGCGRPCEKPLVCGQHLCPRTCHAGDCVDIPGADDHKAAAVVSCGHPCGRERSCGHPCKEKCHPGWPCPDTLCKTKTTIYCACKRKSKDVPCNDDGHGHARRELLECDDDCEVELRNARFREALAIDPNHRDKDPSMLPYIPYPRVLLDKILDENLKSYVPTLEARFRDFLHSEDRTLSLPSGMQPGQTWLAHQIASHHYMRSESYDRGRNHFVRLVKTPGSRLPGMQLSVALELYLKHPADAKTIEEINILHFYDLNQYPGLRPSDLKYCLAKWEGHYRLNWVDETHALAVFDDSSMLEEARASVDLRGVFRTQDDEDDGKAAPAPKSRAVSNTPSPAAGWQVQQSKKAKRKKHIVTPNPVVKDSNPFAAVADAWGEPLGDEASSSEPETWDDDGASDVDDLVGTQNAFETE